MSIQAIPLNKLERHQANVRKTAATGIAELAASIERDGLLQNLTVVEGSKGKHLVVAGGRRLAALQLLAKNKKLPADFAVPVRVVPAGDAEAISLVENQMREQMHPIDQFEAFKSLVDAGQPIPDIAARFGVTDKFVRQRMRLAAVSPKLLTAYRDGKLTMEQLQAFTVSDDHKRQETAFKNMSRWDEADDIRRELLDEAITSKDKRLKYVGADAYQKAGGVLIAADMFSDDATETVSDPELLERMALDKLKKRAEKLQKDEGLAWCEPIIVFRRYGARDDFSNIPTIERPKTKEEAKLYKQLEGKLESLQKQLDAVQQRDDGNEDVDEEDRLIDEMSPLEDQRDAIDQACEIPHPDAQQYAGAVVTIGDNGKIEITRNLIKDSDRKKLKKTEQPKAIADSGDADDETPAPAPVVEASHSEKLMRRLAAHKTAILRNQIARSKSGAGLVAYHMLLELSSNIDLNDIGLEIYGDGPLTLVTRNASLNDADDIDSSKAVQEIKQREAEVLAPILKALKGVTDDREQVLYDYIMSETTEYQLELLSFLVSTQVSIRNGSDDTAVIENDFLTDNIVADYWKPTRASYFDHVSKAQIVAAVNEQVGEERAAYLAKLPKSEAADRAEDNLKDSGWLPGPLRAKQ